MSTDNFKKELKALLNKHNATIETVYEDYGDEAEFIGLMVWTSSNGHYERSDLAEDDLMPDKKRNTV